MNFGDSIKSGFNRYFDFDTRSSRSEYWWWTLFVIVASIILSVLDMMTSGISQSGLGPLGGLFSLVTLIPGISVSVRRLHDLDKTGWWVFIVLVPLIGWIVFLVWAVTKGNDGPNNYGEDPLGYVGD